MMSLTYVRSGVIETNTYTIVWEVTEDLRLKKCHSFGEKGRQWYIQKLCSFTWRGNSYILAGRKGLTLDVYNSTDYKCIKSKHLMTTQVDCDYFVSMEVFPNGEFRACSGLGYCYFLSLETLLLSGYNDFSMSFGLHGSVSFFKFIPSRSEAQASESKKRVVVGGKDRELAVIEIDTHTNVWKSKSLRKVDKALDTVINREPVWIQDVAIMPTDPSATGGQEECSILAVTRFGKLQVYDTGISRFPIDVIQISENPIRHLHALGKHILIADVFNGVTILDQDTHAVVNRLKMPLGPLSTIVTFPLGSDKSRTDKFMVFTGCSLDKRLRLYLFEDGVSTCLDCTEPMGSTISEMVLLETEPLPRVLEEWFRGDSAKRSHI